MPGYSKQEEDEIIRAYLGPAGNDDRPGCPTCGEELVFRNDYGGAGFSIHVRCPDCSRSFSWEQRNLPQPWKELHLQYFLERYQAGEPLRCPSDDACVLYLEYSDEILEFRCPYCNRRGRILKPSPEPVGKRGAAD